MQEHKEFCNELVWGIIELANNQGEPQLRNSSIWKIRRLKVTKNFKLSNQWLVPRNHFGHMEEPKTSMPVMCLAGSWNELDMDCKTPHQFRFGVYYATCLFAVIKLEIVFLDFTLKTKISMGR